MRERIMVVEDDEAMALLLKDGLGIAGYKTEFHGTAENALAAIRRSAPDLLILDIQLPGISGFQLCELLRKEPATASIPVIMLTSMASERHKVDGLKLGADDYVTKPFSEKELLARVESLLRRTLRAGMPGNVLEAQGVRLDLDRQEATIKGAPVPLTRLEFNLLAALLQKKEKVHTYASLGQNVWGDDRSATSHTVTATVSRLKEKLGKSASLIEAVPGVGYRISLGQG